MELVTTEVPEEFIDAVTGEFAFDPVGLTTSKEKLYDRATVEKVIWESVVQPPLDPSTGRPFHLGDIVPLRVLRKSMRKFLKSNEDMDLDVIEDYEDISTEKEIEDLLQDIFSLSCALFRPHELLQAVAMVGRKLNLLRLVLQYNPNVCTKIFRNINGLGILSGIINVVRNATRRAMVHELAFFDCMFDLHTEIMLIVYLLDITADDLLSESKDLATNIIEIVSERKLMSFPYFKTLILRVCSRVLKHAQEFREVIKIKEDAVIYLVVGLICLDISDIKIVRKMNNEDLCNATACIRYSLLSITSKTGELCSSEHLLPVLEMVLKRLKTEEIYDREQDDMVAVLENVLYIFKERGDAAKLQDLGIADLLNDFFEMLLRDDVLFTNAKNCLYFALRILIRLYDKNDPNLVTSDEQLEILQEARDAYGHSHKVVSSFDNIISRRL